MSSDMAVRKFDDADADADADAERLFKNAERLYKAFSSRELIARLTKDQLQRLYDIMTLAWRPFHIDMLLCHTHGKQPVQPLTSERNTLALFLLEIRHRIEERKEDLSPKVYFETRRMAEELARTRPRINELYL